MIPRFRAWDSVEKKFVEHFFITDNSLICNMEKPTSDRKFPIPIEKSELILMQSTGLKDKNGKEIFEGDIVRQVRTQPTTENETITGVVTMIEGAWLIMNDNEQLASYLWSETDGNEIIGNIYENPELLEDKK